VPHAPPCSIPPGKLLARLTCVRESLGYANPRTSRGFKESSALFAESAVGAKPTPSFKYLEQSLFSGQNAKGNICYEIAANDAASLTLFVWNDEADTQKLWFALRS
jgi:hypothetical protein